MIQSQTRTRTENPARWAKAAERAVAGNIEVRQLQSTGQWVATSGSDASVAYELQVTGNVAHGCDCLAGINGDGVCRHRAAFYLLIGALAFDPEPQPPAPAVRCWRCFGNGECFVNAVLTECPICGGNGRLPGKVSTEPVAA